MKWFNNFYDNIKNFFNGHCLNREFLFNSNQFTYMPNYYDEIFDSSLNNYILQDKFLIENDLNLSYSQGKKRFYFWKK